MGKPLPLALSQGPRPILPEEAFLGLVLLEGRLRTDDANVCALREEHFQDRFNRRIFAGLLDLQKRGTLSGCKGPAEVREALIQDEAIHPAELELLAELVGGAVEAGEQKTPTPWIFKGHQSTYAALMLIDADDQPAPPEDWRSRLAKTLEEEKKA